MARRVVTRFLSTAPEQLAALAEALSRSDAQNVWKAAHSIKGAAANVGGARLSEAAHRMELLGKQGDLAGVGELVPGLVAQFDDYRAEIERLWRDWFHDREIQCGRETAR